MKNKIVKYVSAILTVLCILLTFTACSQITGQVDNDSEFESEEAVNEADEVVSEADELKSAEDYVTTEREYTITYGGDFYITGEQGVTSAQTTSCRMPQLLIDSTDAQAINNDIHEKYDEKFDDIEAYYQDYAEKRIDYVTYLNGSILSLVIETRTLSTPNSYFDVYNIDVITGEELSYEEVIELSDISVDEAYSQLYSEIESIFSNAEDDEFIDEELYEIAEGKSLDYNNIQDSMFYFNEYGSLMAAYRYYWIAGADNYGSLFELSAEYNDN